MWVSVGLDYTSGVLGYTPLVAPVDGPLPELHNPLDHIAKEIRP